MRTRDADERLALHLRQTSSHLVSANAGVDHDRDRTNLEQSEDQREEVPTGCYEQNRARATCDAGAFKPMCVTVGLLFELPERDVRIPGTSRPVSTRGPDDGALVRCPRGHLCQLLSDVDRVAIRGGTLGRCVGSAGRAHGTVSGGADRGAAGGFERGFEGETRRGCASRNSWTNGPIASPASSRT